MIFGNFASGLTDGLPQIASPRRRSVSESLQDWVRPHDLPVGCGREEGEPGDKTQNREPEEHSRNRIGIFLPGSL